MATGGEGMAWQRPPDGPRPDAPDGGRRLSHSAEDYLKAIFKLQAAGTGKPVTTSAVAEQMGVSMASATNMMKRLADLRLVEHTPYQGVTLTVTGRRVALEVIRHHRLVELFLSEHLGFGLHEVDAEAERLEHVLSDALERKIDRLLGHPTHDPHGDPIPSLEGHLPEEAFAALSDLRSGDRATVRRLKNQDSESLRRLTGMGLVPGADLQVESRDAGGEVAVRVEGARHGVAPEDAASILVERKEPGPEGDR